MLLIEKSAGLRPNTLAHAIEAGLPLVPCYGNGMPVNVGEPLHGATHDRDVLRWHWRRGIRRYEFVPGDSGFIALHVFDNPKCPGLAQLRELFCAWGEVWDGDMMRLPCYTQHKNGFDVLYRWRGDELAMDELSRHVAVIHAGARILAPGSVVGNEPVLLFGSMENTPEFPPDLLRHVLRAEEAVAQ